MESFRKCLPWWFRIGAKIVLACLPIPYFFWKRIRLFEHGDMDQPEKAYAVFIEHARTGGVLIEKASPLCVNIDVASNKEVNYGIFKSSDGRRVKKSLAA